METRKEEPNLSPPSKVMADSERDQIPRAPLAVYVLSVHTTAHGSGPKQVCCLGSIRVVYQVMKA